MGGGGGGVGGGTAERTSPLSAPGVHCARAGMRCSLTTPPPPPLPPSPLPPALVAPLACVLEPLASGPPLWKAWSPRPTSMSVNSVLPARPLRQERAAAMGG